MLCLSCDSVRVEEIQSILGREKKSGRQSQAEQWRVHQDHILKMFVMLWSKVQRVFPTSNHLVVTPMILVTPMITVTTSVTALTKASLLRSASVCQVPADIHPVPSMCETLWIDTEAKPDVTPGLAKHNGSSYESCSGSTLWINETGIISEQQQGQHLTEDISHFPS